jgi:asparagine synthase (glutamine-hydrolysing)
MCGFVSVVTRAPVSETMDVSRLRPNVLHHRGPDSTGELQFPHVFVRHWRLSIVDVTDAGNQPYGSGDSRLIYNGEIYDYAEVASRLSLPVRGDTALLYELCRRGIDRQELAEARGFYAYLYLSNNGMTVTGRRDPFGKKPLYYHLDEVAGIAVFASEERAILDVLGARSIDFGAVAEYLLYKQVFHGRTCFRGIKQLAPGAGFELDVRRWQFSVDRDWAGYYDAPAAEVFSLTPRQDARAAGGEGTLATQVDETLRDAVDLRVPLEVPACVALSGGVDSALIAHMATRSPLAAGISRLITIGFEEPTCDESRRAAEIARALALTTKHVIVSFAQQDLLRHLERCIAHATAPLEHPHYLAYHLLCASSSEYAKVLLTGEGADELFMGYEHYRVSGHSFAFREYLTPDDERQFAEPAGGRQPFDDVRDAADVSARRRGALSSRMASREAELKSHLLSLLSRNDKMGMAHSVEIRAPFLDRRLLEIALAASDADLVVEGAPKQVLKQMFARRFPGIEATEKKVGFRVPFDEMFMASRERGPVRDYCALAVHALRSECGLEARAVDSVSPRLGWSLLNIGIFLDTQGYTS